MEPIPPPPAGVTLHPPPPPRPGRREEAIASVLFFALAPGLPRVDQPPPPPELAPWEELQIPRSRGEGSLAGTWYPAAEPARGAVLFLHPWLEWGKAYFHRRGRLEAARAAGLHALAVDLPGLGGSGPKRGFFDVDVGDAVAALAARCPGLPLHVWGVSAGGYWAHHALARHGGYASAFFEDVSPHLLEWSSRMVPLGRPFYALFRTVLPRSHRFMDLRRYAPHLGVRRVAYVSGADDPGVRPEDTATLARLAGGSALVVPDAGHLAAIRRDGAGVIALALDTFATSAGG